MGRVVATYITRITLREPEDLAAGDVVAQPPLLEALDEAIEKLLRSAPAKGKRIPDVHVSSERVDQ